MLSPKDYLSRTKLQSYGDIFSLSNYPCLRIDNYKTENEKRYVGYENDRMIERSKSDEDRMWEMVNNGSALIMLLDCYESGMKDDEIERLTQCLPLWEYSVSVAYDNPIESYREMLKDIYNYYLCYLNIVWGKNVSPKSQYGNHCVDCHEWLNYWCYNHDSKIILRYFDDNNGLKPYYAAESIYDAIVYQLLERIFAGKNGINGAMIYHCEQCGKEFIRYTRKKHFCDYCGAGAQRTRKCRERGKNQNAAKE